MPNGAQPDIYNAVNFAIAQSGKPYHAYGDRFGLSYYDCSGLVIRSVYEADIPLPPGISVVNKTGNTVSLYNWARSVGGLVSVAKGIATKGAIMIRGKWYGVGPLGHTSISLGDGREMAAHGRRTGIGVTTLNASFYQDAFIIPGVNYHLGPPPTPIPEEEPMFIPSPHRPIPDTSIAGAYWTPNNPNQVLLEHGASISGDRPLSANWKPGDTRVWEPVGAGGHGAGIGQRCFLKGHPQAGQPTGTGIVLREASGATRIGNWS